MEIVNFKKSYVFGDKVQYVKRGFDYINANSKPADIAALNQLMDSAFKVTVDEELGEWIFATGAGYRGVFPSKSKPYFVLDTLSPLQTFVVYSSDFGKEPVLCGKLIEYTATDDDTKQERIKLGVYTKEKYIEYDYVAIPSKVFPLDSAMRLDADFKEIKNTKNGLGRLPIIEYPCNMARMGAFEPVKDLLDALNSLASDRINGVEQFVNALLVFLNCEYDGTLTELMQEGGLKVKFPSGVNGDVKYLVEELNQEQVQKLVDWTYKQMLNIVRMPSSEMPHGSPTGAGIEVGQGWIDAENDAKSFGNIFDRSEMRFLDAALQIVKANSSEYKSKVEFENLDVSEIEVKFTRNKLANIMVKAQTMLNLRQLGVHPRIIFQVGGMFDDPENVYNESKPYIDKMWYQGQNASTSLKGYENTGENQTSNANTEGENPD